MLVLCFVTSDSRAIEICQQYWELDDGGAFRLKVATLEHTHRMAAVQLRHVIRESCIAVDPNLRCAACGTMLVATARAEYLEARRRPTWYCPECAERRRQQRREAERRRAEKLMAERRAEEERLRALIRTSFPIVPLRQVDPDALSLSEAIYLLAVTRAAATEDYERIKPIADSPTPLSPRAEFDCVILERLSQNALLCVDSGSTLDAFDFQNGAVHLRRPRRVAYKCAFAPTTEARGWLIDQLEAVFASGNWPERWSSELPEVVSLIGIEQCIAYLELQLAERDLPFRAGTKTRAMFQRMLEHHSLAQAFNHVWVAARYAADYLVRSRISRSHAANSAVSFLNTRMERALHEHWNLKPFRPDPRCCRCTVVDVLNSTVLNLGDLAFTRRHA